MHKVNAEGLKALVFKPRSGRPTRLTPKMQAALEDHLEQSPMVFGLPRVQWDGPTLVKHVKRPFGVTLSVRQAQAWMHQMGYGLKRASDVYLQARKKEAVAFSRKLKKN